MQEKKIPDPPTESENIQSAQENNYSTSETVELPHNDYVELAENKLAEILGVKVKIVSIGNTNQIQINFSDDEQLLNIIRNFDKNVSPNTEINVNMTNEEKLAALRKFSTEGTIN